MYTSNLNTYAMNTSAMIEIPKKRYTKDMKQAIARTGIGRSVVPGIKKFL